MRAQKILGSIPKNIGIFTVIGALTVLVMLIRISSSAETVVDTEGSADVQNVEPVIEVMTISDQEAGAAITEFTPNEGTTKNLYVYGSASDENGCTDIEGIAVWVFHAPTMPEGPRPLDNNDTYRVDAEIGGCAGAGDDDVTFSAVVPIAHYVDPTDAGGPYPTETWTALANVHDPEDDSMAMQNFEINSLAAFDTDDHITYGVLPLGATSTEQVINITNTGNHRVHATIIATSTRNGDMVSDLQDFADIPADRVHFSKTQGFAYDAGIPVSGSVPYLLDISLLQQTEDTEPPPQVPTYWMIKMPESGLKGTYSNSLDFIASPY